MTATAHLAGSVNIGLTGNSTHGPHSFRSGVSAPASCQASRSTMAWVIAEHDTGGSDDAMSAVRSPESSV